MVKTYKDGEHGQHNLLREKRQLKSNHRLLLIVSIIGCIVLCCMLSSVFIIEQTLDISLKENNSQRESLYGMPTVADIHWMSLSTSNDFIWMLIHGDNINNATMMWKWCKLPLGSLHRWPLFTPVPTAHSICHRVPHPHVHRIFKGMQLVVLLCQPQSGTKNGEMQTYSRWSKNKRIMAIDIICFALT